MNTSDAFVNTSSYSPVAASSMLTLEKFLEGIFPAERKIPRRIKDKNTLDIDTFSMIYRSIRDSFVIGARDLASYFFKTRRLSNLLKHISLKDLPDSVYYRDIELFYLKDL
ncbi:hypothetical protein N7536_009025 [Penicillium majusculum]|nr:hypothetical protein N7536_009025 [Penicillium majusculum]